MTNIGYLRDLRLQDTQRVIAPKSSRRQQIILVGLAVMVGLIVVTGFVLMRRNDSRLTNTIRLKGAINLATVRSDGELLASVNQRDKASGRHSIEFWRTNDGVKVAMTAPYSIYSLIFSPDGSYLVASGNDGVRIFRASDGQLVRAMPGDQVFCVAVSNDGHLLADANAQGLIRVRRFNEETILRTFNVGKPITSLVFGTESDVLIAGSASSIGLMPPNELSPEENPIFVFPIGSSLPQYSIRGHKYGVLALAFSPDGKKLASGGSDGDLRLWDFGERRIILSAHVKASWFQSMRRIEPAINHISFDSSGGMLAAAVSTGDILTLNVTTNVTRYLRGHTESVLYTQFSGENLLSVGEDNTVRRWTLGQ